MRLGGLSLYVNLVSYHKKQLRVEIVFEMRKMNMRYMKMGK